MTEDLFGQSVETIHETLGNDPTEWLRRANSLSQSAKILYRNIEPPTEELDDPNLVLKWFDLYNIGRMIRGMALECFLKAIWLFRGNLLVIDGKFVNIPQTKNHDLYGMYLACFPENTSLLSQEEKELLSRFSFSISSARYPISKSPKGDYPKAPTAVHKMYWNRVSEDDEKSYWTILEKILQVLKKYEKT